MGDGGLHIGSHAANLRVRGRADRLRTIYFIAVAVLAALVPLILFAGLWVRAELAANHRELEEFLAARASGLSARLDAEMRQQISVLQAIASLPSLDEPSLDDFHGSAVRMLPSMPHWAEISLLDASGQWVASTSSPVGADLSARAVSRVVRQVVESRQPAIDSYQPGRSLNDLQDTVVIYVPVLRENAVRYILAAGMRAGHVQDVLQQLQSPELLTVVVDEDGNVLARSRGSEEFRGQPVNAELLTATTDRSSGLFEAPTLDGQSVLTAFRRSPVTGWLAVAAADLRQTERISRRSTWTIVAAGALSLTLAGILAVFLFYNVVERRVSDERLAASRALSELDARLLATTQAALSEQRKAASEREVLLREIYHRVKNNLQIIQSLLRLGSRELDPEQREPFELAIRRIGAMARVHTLLYNSPDLASIDLKDYLEELVAETANGFGAEERGIRTILEAESMRVPLDTAIPLAFIAVEILTNAFKHAFPEGRSGTITVTATQAGEQGMLTVVDDGVGMPEAPRRKRPLGLNLVTKLVEQIGGTLEAPKPGGSQFQITFPLAGPAQAPLPVFPSGPAESRERSGS